jgi:hypothetical protein
MVFPAFKEDVKIDGPPGSIMSRFHWIDRDAAAIGRQAVFERRGQTTQIECERECLRPRRVGELAFAAWCASRADGW